MQGILLRGRAIKTSQAYMKNQGETTTANLTSNVNPLSVIANNPFLLSTLGGLTGLGTNTMATGMGTMNMGGTSGYGTQGFQGYPTYQGGMMGMPMPGMIPGYGTMQQGIPMQTSGFGYTGTGDQTNSKTMPSKTRY